MANEAHSGLARCICTREVGVRVIQVEGGWVPMCCHFAAMSGVQPFVIDQTVTVDFPGDGPQPWARQQRAGLDATLTAHGGTAGILRSQAPPPLNDWPGVDAVVLSNQNDLT